MRSIKFRVWDKSLEEMRYSINIPSDYTERNGSLDLINMFQTLNQRYVFMQYTGLKDKNGKEIYKRDIVKVSYESNRLSIDDFEIIGEVIWSPEYLQFLVRTNIKHLKDGSVEFELYELCDTEYYSVLEIEIIGNIYEHPHLLEEQHG